MTEPPEEEVVTAQEGLEQCRRNMEARERELRAHLRLLEEEERLLRLAEAAQRGEYGICADCGQEIPAARLEIVPDAERCVSCQEAASGGRRR